MRKCGVFRHPEKKISFVRASCRLIIFTFSGYAEFKLEGPTIFASTVDLKVLIEDIPNSAISFSSMKKNKVNQACPEKLNIYGFIILYKNISNDGIVASPIIHA